ncbi:amidohydrolase family protein [Neisseria sp. Ec49-e6-T10]|uniref:amidohydrolase family protein n=1 Tax=Neisseria sp. Ec49-e6-T10 TaxID=3140744 RepID=UPI003EB7C4F5
MTHQIKRVDAHQHFWVYQDRDYSWITDEMPALKQDRLPNDLYPLLQKHGFDGCIAVQARQTNEETAFLTQLAQQNPWILGVIGWLDLRSPSLEKELEQWQAYSIIKGYRHIVQDEPKPAEFLADPAFNRGVDIVLNQNKIYEVLIHAKDLAAATDFCRRHDQAILVLDHVGKPNIGHESAKDWQKRLQPLAQQKHVYCKLSGLITEAGNHWQQIDILPYIEVALELFGPNRLMFGSDWPVCLLSGQYAQVYSLVEQAMNNLTQDEQNAIWGMNAKKVYQLS